MDRGGGASTIFGEEGPASWARDPAARAASPRGSTDLSPRARAEKRGGGGGVEGGEREEGPRRVTGSLLEKGRQVVAERVGEACHDLRTVGVWILLVF